ncbi:MAG TPA: arginine--tRNA ligase [Actinomycetota bacterium]|nr:arginine--tRNA ligase [Actinomycetota bacterium]
MIEDQLRALLADALAEVAHDLELKPPLPVPELERPRQKDFGDFTTNLAMVAASRAGTNPRATALAIVGALEPAPFVAKVDIAGPGFINVWTTDEWLYDVLREIAREGARYGGGASTGQRVQVEFVSANPTGPLTIGHARNAAIGDALARVLAFVGHDVEREYYFNDAGGQMDRFGVSVEARYLQLLGRGAEVPEDGYHGAYVTDLAREILEAHGPGLADLPSEERFLGLRTEGARLAMEEIRATLTRFGVVFDSYLLEGSLAEKGAIAEAIERLRGSGHVYEAEGAVWFRSSAYGDEKDRVVVRSDGTHTYFAADVAYVLDKFARGFDRAIYVWGADHHGTVARVKGAADALGIDPDRVEILLYQFVSFLRGGEPVKMSKRAGTFVSLDELIDEVGTDAARFHLLLFSNDRPMNFDIEEVARQSLENPVYYVQYGHARIASILRKAEGEGVRLGPIEDADLALLATERELDLLRALADVPGLIANAAEQRAPHKLTHAAQDLAATFHRFYTECRVVSEDEPLTQARLWLSWSTKRVLATLLDLVGVTAPESMERLDVSDPDQSND